MTGGVAAVVQALVQARQQRQPADWRPLANALATPDEAYAVQAEVASAFGWFDAGVPHAWKSGGPARAAVATHAALPPPNVLASPAGAGSIHFNVRFIEAEVALRLARDVSPAEASALEPGAVVGLVDAMAVSLEVVDSRWRDFMQAPPLLKLADLQSHGALVLGAWRPFSTRDWMRQDCTVLIGDAPPRTFTGTHSFGDPAWGVAGWLRHATAGGRTVRAGTVLTTGTWCGMLPAATGEQVEAEFPGIGRAVVQF